MTIQIYRCIPITPSLFRFGFFEDFSHLAISVAVMFSSSLLMRSRKAGIPGEVANGPEMGMEPWEKPCDVGKTWFTINGGINHK